VPYKLADWLRILGRLQAARQNLEKFRAIDKRKRAPKHALLDDSIISIRDVAVYLINVLLELRGMKPDLAHQSHLRAEELRAAGHLAGDYGDYLEQLEQYRKAAQYLDYVATPSTHFSSRNVSDCLAVTEKLLEEVATALRAAGKDVP
jgi:hypothetical protein